MDAGEDFVDAGGGIHGASLLEDGMDYEGCLWGWRYEEWLWGYYTKDQERV